MITHYRRLHQDRGEQRRRGGGSDTCHLAAATVKARMVPALAEVAAVTAGQQGKKMRCCAWCALWSASAPAAEQQENPRCDQHALKNNPGGRGVSVAVDETVILLHPPLPLVVVSTWMTRGRQ